MAQSPETSFKYTRIPACVHFEDFVCPRDGRPSPRKELGKLAPPSHKTWDLEHVVSPQHRDQHGAVRATDISIVANRVLQRLMFLALLRSLTPPVLLRRSHMLSQFFNISSSKGAPSALLVLGVPNAPSFNILHVIPEDGTIEQFSSFCSYPPTIIRRREGIEQSREDIGTVMLHAGDGESPSAVLQGVADRASKIMGHATITRSASQDIGSTEVSRLVEDILKAAALEAIHAIEGRSPSMNAMQLYQVFVVYIKRSKPGKIIDTDNLTSY